MQGKQPGSQFVDIEIQLIDPLLIIPDAGHQLLVPLDQRPDGVVDGGFHQSAHLQNLVLEITEFVNERPDHQFWALRYFKNSSIDMSSGQCSKRNGLPRVNGAGRDRLENPDSSESKAERELYLPPGSDSNLVRDRGSGDTEVAPG